MPLKEVVVFGQKRLVPIESELKGLKELKEMPESKISLAIIQSFGNRSALARLLNANYNAVRALLNEEKYAELFKQAKEQLVDKASACIASVLDDQEIDSRTRIDVAKFILKTQGKADGWSESPQIAQQINVQSNEVSIEEIFGMQD